MEQANIVVLPAAVQALVTRSWEYSYRYLWSKCILREDEIQNIQNGIANYYWSIDPVNFRECAEQYYEIFCKRVSEIQLSGQFSIDLCIFRSMLAAS